MDIGYTVFQQIGALVNNKRWGDISTYDINVLVKPEAGATGYYTVQPLGKEPLTAEDQVIIDKGVDVDQLKKFSTPPTYKAVEEKIQKIHEDLNSNPSGMVQSKPAQAAKKPAAKGKVEVPVADESEEFEDYN